MDASFPSLSEAKKEFEKWDIDKSSYIAKFRFDEAFDCDPRAVEQFFVEFFNSAAFKHGGKILINNRRESWGGLSAVQQVQLSQLQSNVTSMDFFDRLYTHGIVNSKSGFIKKCFEDFVEGVSVSDELRKLLMSEDSEHYCLFNEEERKQLLFKLFSRICVGGGMCQFEDEVNPYLNATKLVYKDLISVRRNKSTQAVEVCSQVYQIHGFGPSPKLFPNDSSFNMCLASIDPAKRELKLFYSGWLPFW